MKKHRRTPKQIAGLVFLTVIVGSIVLIASITLLIPGAISGDMIARVSNSTCPVALVVATLSYFWAKSRQ